MDRGGAFSSFRDQLICRRGLYAPGKWTRKDEPPKYEPDRTCDVEHLRLDLEVDFPARAVEATCRQRLVPSYGPFDSIVLDAWDLQIRSVRDGAGRDLPYTFHNRKLTVRFLEPVTGPVDLVISYRVEDPIDGLYFQGPNEAEPHATWQLWSQGEDEGARHWIPCHDAPHERMTTELLATVPAEFTVVSNGALLEVKEAGGLKTWHFRESIPHVSYLISLVVGVFNRIADGWNQIPVEYYVEPGREEEGRRSFGRTPDMIEFFSRKLECPYPYEKYSQVTVRHFHFGGMENTSATTQTETTLHDERAALDFSSDELVAHELAHQWFGDLVTCKSWAHAWLNEGFATYFEALWKEWDKGREEFDYEMIGNAAAYMSEPYRRPIATAKYGHPFEMFDMHLYPKGAWVLHMLRRRLGDDLFWKSMRLYLRRHAPGPVETLDLERAFEDASGKSLAGFFDQWIFSPGHPELEGEVSWDEQNKWVKLAIKQVQKREGGTPIFHLPLRLEARRADGNVEATFEMDREQQTFYLPLAEKPVWVLLDPEGAILRETRLRRSREWLEAAVIGRHRDDRIPARVDVVRQLAEDAGPSAVAVIGRVLREDPFWGVQCEAARALSRIHTPNALAELLGAVSLPNPKARRAVVTALGSWRDPQAAGALRRIVRDGDPSYFVQMAAEWSLGRAGGAEASKELREQLQETLQRRDWHDIIATGVVEGLVAARDEGAIEDLLAVARDRSRYWGLRSTALRGLGEIGAARPILARRLAEELIPILDDPEYLIAARLPGALVKLGDPSGIAALRRKGETTSRLSLRESCFKAADEIAAQLRPGEDVDRLREEMEKLRDETRRLKETVETVRAKVMPEPETPPPAGAKAPARTKAGVSVRARAKTQAKAGSSGKARANARPKARSSPAPRDKR